MPRPAGRPTQWAALAPSIAQPEDAGLRIGRIPHDVGDRPLLAAMQHGALDLVAVTHRAGEQAARDPGIGEVAPLAQCRRELGNGGDPVVDRAPGDAEEAGQLLGGGAQQAVIMGEFAIFGLVGGGTS